MSFIKSTLTRYVLSFVLIITIVAYFIEYKPIDTGVNILLDWVVVMVAWSLPIGLINIIGRSVKNIQRRKEEWYLDIVTLFFIAIMSITGLFFGISNDLYQWLYNNINLPVGAMVYALTGFYIVAAAYRSFKVRNVESALLLGSAVLILFWNAPIGRAIFPPINLIGQWLSDYGQTTGFRVIMVGFALGVISLSVRYIFIRESLTGEKKA